MLTAAMQGKTSVTKQAFGQTSDGTAVDLYTLADGKVEARIYELWGNHRFAAHRRIARENSTDVVLGYDSFEGYRTNPAYLAPSLAVTRIASHMAASNLTAKTYFRSQE